MALKFNYKYALGGLVILGLLAGCSTKDGPKEDTTPRVNRISHRTLPPEPLYVRTRWVHLPEVLPERDLDNAAAKPVFPVYHLKIKNTPLEKIASVLAETSRYSSYCSSEVADKKMTLNTLGNIDELGAEIAAKANIKVVIDHQLKSVRFMPLRSKVSQQSEQAVSEQTKEEVSPRFYKQEVTADEHQSIN